MSSGKSCTHKLSWHIANYSELPTKLKQSIASMRIRPDKDSMSWIATVFRLYPKETEVIYAKSESGIVLATIVLTSIEDKNLISIYTRSKYRGRGIMSSIVSDDYISSYLKSINNLVGYVDCVEFMENFGIKVKEIDSFP